MKAKKKIALSVAAVLTGVTLIALTGCEWFAFKDKKATTVTDTLGYENGAGDWLTTSTDLNREAQIAAYDRDYAAYQSAQAAGKISKDTSFEEYLKTVIKDDSAMLTSPLRASVALYVSFGGSTLSSSGSGVIYSLKDSSSGDGSKDAYVITNYHVIDGNKNSRSIHAFLYGERNDLITSNTLTATYVGGSETEDVAVLSMNIPQDRADFVKSVTDADMGFRDSDFVNVGEKVYAVGNALGQGISTVSGVVSVEAEYRTFGSYDRLTMRTDAPVNHGNSGCGLFGWDGKLLGIVCGGKEVEVKGTDGKVSQIPVGGMGFALHINRVVSVVQSILDQSEDKAGKCFRGIFGTLEVLSSKGVYDDETHSIDIEEEVVVKEWGSSSPFSGNDAALNQPIKYITVTNSENEITIEKKILRKHQLETALYNLRAGDNLEITFADGTKINATYNKNFIEVK